MRHMQENNGRNIPKEDNRKLCEGCQRKNASSMQRMPEEITDKGRNTKKSLMPP